MQDFLGEKLWNSKMCRWFNFVDELPEGFFNLNFLLGNLISDMSMYACLKATFIYMCILGNSEVERLVNIAALIDNAVLERQHNGWTPKERPHILT